jgi:hypothetical protein
VLVAGGAESINPRAKAEVWDPETASFGPAGELAEGRWSHTTTLLSDGRVLVAGGGPGGEPWVFASAETWDPATALFTPSGSIAEERSDHTTTLLPDGRVLIVGGALAESYAGGLTSAELYDPAASIAE